MSVATGISPVDLMNTDGDVFAEIVALLERRAAVNG